jgi:hypothetical protein
VIFIDRLLVSGVRFVLDKVATAADSELNDASRLRESLLDAQMRLELGQITEEEFLGLEAVLTARLREIRERELEQVRTSKIGIAGIDVAFDDPVDERDGG